METKNNFITLVIKFIMSDINKNFDMKYCCYVQKNSKVFTNSFSVCKEDGKIFEIAETLISYYDVMKSVIIFKSTEIDLFKEVTSNSKFIQYDTFVNDFGITNVFRDSSGGITITMERRDIINKIKKYIINFLIFNEAGKTFGFNKIEEEKIIKFIESEIIKLIYKEYL